MSTTKLRRVVYATILISSIAFADEGMWLYTNPPTKILKEKYNFEPSAAWLEHLQKSSVRFNSGGSGSFVSPDALVMTNHHVGADCLAKISTAAKNYLATGFIAKSYAEEPRCVDLELNVLMSIEDVTNRVNAAAKPGMAAAEANRARQAVINQIEKESLDKTGLRSDVVTLYNGGQYHLYRYKKYTDVRLVFAPEKDIAFFGGDPDNFEYPRYDLDVTFFRAYENGKPAKIEHYLKWSANGAKENDLVFVSGHPGRTERLFTVKHLEYARDTGNPATLNLLRRREIMLQNYGERSLENARRAEDELFGVQNSRKAYLGMQGGLQDPQFFARKVEEENKLRAAVNASPELKSKYGDAWDQIAATVKAYDAIYQEHRIWEGAQGFHSEVFGIARALVRYAAESKKPNAERLREFNEAGIESFKQELFSEAPIYNDLETAKLADSLGLMVEVVGASNPLVQKVLNDKSPQERASELIRGSKLASIDERKRLFEGGQAAIDASNDPMIQLAKLVDPRARELRKIREEKVDEPRKQAYGKIAQARFAVYGSSQYPDATFTLRLAFGTAKGFQENGKQIPWTTTIGGTFAHSADHGYKEPFALPESWKSKRDNLKLDTPFNFVSTADIIGGNSGSPVVNRDGEVVGLIFDGNIQSLVLDYAYSEDQARAVSVHSAGIIEALRGVYQADGLIKEITGKK
jgi:hypothetical protein